MNLFIFELICWLVILVDDNDNSKDNLCMKPKIQMCTVLPSLLSPIKKIRWEWEAGKESMTDFNYFVGCEL
jgi:hypothetical protein